MPIKGAQPENGWLLVPDPTSGAEPNPMAARSAENSPIAPSTALPWAGSQHGPTAPRSPRRAAQGTRCPTVRADGHSTQLWRSRAEELRGVNGEQSDPARCESGWVINRRLNHAASIQIIAGNCSDTIS